MIVDDSVTKGYVSPWERDSRSIDPLIDPINHLGLEGYTHWVRSREPFGGLRISPSPCIRTGLRVSTTVPRYRTTRAQAGSPHWQPSGPLPGRQPTPRDMTRSRLRNLLGTQSFIDRGMLHHLPIP
jgi:hypothetical protein